MSNHNEEKHRLETAAIDLFINISREGRCIDYHVADKQECPDFVLEDEQGNKIGVEVTHIFYDSEEAKMLLGRSDKKIHGLENFDTFIEELNKAFKKKGEKGNNYKSEYPLSLLIRNASPLWGLEDIEHSLDKLHVPTDVYQEVWMLTRDNSSNWYLVKIE
jgi:hypothetical protein